MEHVSLLPSNSRHGMIRHHAPRVLISILMLFDCSLAILLYFMTAKLSSQESKGLLAFFWEQIYEYSIYTSIVDVVVCDLCSYFPIYIH